MTSLPHSSSSQRSIPLNSGRGESSSGSGLLGRSFHSRDYMSTSPAAGEDEREGSGSQLVTPVIDDSEVEGEGGRYLSHTSLESFGKRRARSAASVLQGKDGELEEADDEDWFDLPNPNRRKEHLTRWTILPIVPPPFCVATCLLFLLAVICRRLFIF